MSTTSAKKGSAAIKKVVAGNHPSSNHYPKVISWVGWSTAPKTLAIEDARRRFARPQRSLDWHIEQLGKAVDSLTFKMSSMRLQLRIRKASLAELTPVITALFQLVKQEKDQERRNKLVDVLRYAERKLEKAKFKADPDLRERLKEGAAHLAHKAQSGFPAIPVPAQPDETEYSR